MAKRIGQIRGRLAGPAATIDPGPVAFGIDVAGSGEAGAFRLVSDIPDMVNSKVGILSVWVHPSTTGNKVIFAVDASNSENSILVMNTNTLNRLLFTGRNVGLTANVLDFQGAAGTELSVDTWHHILASWDLVNDTLLVYLDDVDIWSAAALNSTSNTAIGYQRANEEIQIAGGDLIGAPWTDCISQFYFNPLEFLDFTLTANRRKFISATGGSVVLGADGSLPTGSAPLVYLDNLAATWTQNRGTGGNFTEFGDLADCDDDPPT